MKNEDHHPSTEQQHVNNREQNTTLSCLAVSNFDFFSKFIMEFINTQNLIRFASITPKFDEDHLQRLIEQKAEEFFQILVPDISKAIGSRRRLLSELEFLGEEDLRDLVQCVPGAMQMNKRT